jgi:hypothetical protein
MHLDAAGCRRGDAADDLQKRRLTGAVAADNADALALAKLTSLSTQC